MNFAACTAVVVRGTDWSETSRIATLFSRELGKLRVLAKGGRRLKSNFDSALDLLTVCRVTVIRKQHGGLDLLTEAQVAERFPGLRSHLPSLYAGYYVAELLADGTQDYDPHPLLFDAALDTLRQLGPDSPVPAADRIAAFELAWLRELGYGPRLSVCAGCDRALEGPSLPAPLGFSPAVGGVVCPDCRGRARDHRPLSSGGLLALRALNDGPAALEPGVRREVRAVLGHAVSSVLGRRPRTLGYLDDG